MGCLKIERLEKNRPSLKVIQASSKAFNNESRNYCPYGSRRMHYATSSLKSNYGYNGIEFVNDFGLGLNMATFRNLQSDIGIWHQVDPKASSTFSLTPYGSQNQNPISNVDPEGDIAFLPIAIGAGISVFTNGINNAVNAQGFFQGAGRAAFFGALGGGLASGIGGAFGATGSVGNEFARAGAHALSGGLQSELQGGSFGQGFLSGGISSGIGSGISAVGGNSFDQILGGGLGGGLGSAIGGGNFLHGFGQGVAVGALNHAAHGVANTLNRPDDYIIFDGEYLNYYDDTGNLLYRVKANSGMGEHMNNRASQSVKNAGPIPEGGYKINLTQGVPTERSGGGWGEFAVRLNSLLATKITNRIYYRRGGFFLHQDGNFSTNPGSAGCIGVCTKADSYKVWNALKSYQAAGNSYIYVHVQY